MRRNKVTLSLSPLALLTLAACKGTSGSSGFSASSGKVEDGPLQNAIAFLDYNDNGILDAGEPSERTGVDGSYSLTPTQANYSIVAVTDETTFDTISQSFVPGITLKAPSNSSMVTPTTTLMEDGGLTAAEVMVVLGLPENMDPLTYSAHADISALTGTAKTDAEELALQVELANQQILSVVNSFAATAEGSGVSEAAAFSAALMSVAEVIKTEANKSTVVTLDLSDATALAEIETKIVSKVNVLAASDSTIKNNEFAATMAETVKAAAVVNTKIQTITDTNLKSDATKDILSISQVLKNQVHEAAVATVANNAGNAEGVAVTTASVAFASVDTTAFENAISNKAPTGIALSSSSISEAAGTLLKVGELSTTDAAAADGTASTGFKYSIGEVDGTDHAAFTIDASTGALSLKTAPNYETQSSYKVVVTTTDAGGKKYSEELMISVTNIDDGPTTGTVTVTGGATSGGTLTATHSLTDPDGLTATVGYQWMANGVAISGATESTYTLDASHINAKISVNITVSDNMGVETVHSSAMTKVTANSNVVLPDYIGSSFKLVIANFTYEEAVADAIARGGQLASVTSAEELIDLNYVSFEGYEQALAMGYTSLFSAPDGGGAEYSWLGANDKAQEGSFVWETGEAVVIENFGRIEPDNFGGNQNGLAISHENWPDGASDADALGLKGQWNDISTDNKLSYIIEYEPSKLEDVVMVATVNYELYGEQDAIISEAEAAASSLDAGVTAMLNRISDDGDDLVYQAQMNDYANYISNDGYTPTATSSALMLTDNITGYKLTAEFANFAPDSIADLTTAFDSFDLADSSTWVITGGLSSLTMTDETGLGIWTIAHAVSGTEQSVTLTDLQANNGVVNAVKLEGSNLSNQWSDFVGLINTLETASNAAGATDKSILSALQTSTSDKYALDKISIIKEGSATPAAALEFNAGSIALNLGEFSMELAAIGGTPDTKFDTDAFLDLIDSQRTTSATAAEISAALSGATGGSITFSHATHGKLMDLTIADFAAAEKAVEALDNQGKTAGGASAGRINGDNYTLGDDSLTVAYYENSNMSMSEFYDLLNPSFLNEAPTVANPIPDQTVVYGSNVVYQFDGNTFMDLDVDDILTYTVTTEDPDGNISTPVAENFDSATRTFSGTVEGDLGTYSTTVTATDKAGASVSDTFDTTVVDAPGVVRGKVVINGPLNDALVFLDYNANGILDAGEPSVRTQQNSGYGVGSSYLLTSTQETYSIVAVTDAATIDTASGTAVSAMTLKAPSDASMVTPITTLMVASNLTAAQAVQVLGLPVGIDPLNFNAFASGVNAAEALAVQIVSNQLMTVVNTFAAAAEGSGASQVDAFNLALSSVAKFMQVKVADSTTIDLNSSTDLDAIRAQVTAEITALAASNAGLNSTAFNAISDDTVAAVQNVNAKIATITDLNSSETKNIFSTTEVLATQVKTAGEAEVNSSGTSSIDFTSNVTVLASSVNSAPTDITISSSSISEAATSLIVGTLGSTDVDQASGVSHTYKIEEIAGTDHESFSVNAVTGELSLKVQPNYETKSSYQVALNTMDEGGKTFSEMFTILITDAPPAVLGKVTLDGPLDGALVFADYNGNGALDTSETSTRTGSDGSYTINPTQVYSSIIAITDAMTVNIATGTAVGNGKFLMYGQAGNDVLTGTAGDNIIDGRAGADTITTGNGADHVVLRSGDGGSTLAAADTLTDFTNGADKFLLADGLSFSDLTIAADANNAANTVVSITATSEYLIKITGVAYGYIDTNDFVTAPEIV